MTHDTSGKRIPETKKDRRDARLAAELRANLKRRKTAARGKCEPDAAGEKPEKSEA